MSIELAMWFALGFLTAGILALVVMGAVWRRAVRLTSRRVAASLPAGVEALMAEQDMLRAHHARDIRRMELAVADMRRTSADARLAVGRAVAETDGVRVALEAETAVRRAAEALAEERGAELERRAERIATLEGELAASVEAVRALESAAAAREAEIVQTAQDHARALEDAEAAREATRAEMALQQATLATGFEAEAAKAREEAAGRRRDINALEEQVRALKLQFEEKQTRLDAVLAAHGRAETAAAQEKDRADRLDRRIARLVADVADREERIDRVNRELERARQALVVANARVAALGGTGDGAVAAGDNILRSLAQLENRNHELEEKLAALGSEVSPTARAELKASLSDLAARIVHLTRLAEGASSSIDRIAAAPDGTATDMPSLAQRIRDLQRISDERIAAEEAARQTSR